MPLSSSNNVRPAARAFTLIELLVVISIIALLVAILLPTLDRARHTTRMVLCQSNLRQVGMVFLMYENDYHVFPSRDPAATGAASFPERVVANGNELDAYLSGRGVWYCPDRAAFTTTPGSNYKFEVPDWPQTGYFNWAGSIFTEGMKTRWSVYPSVSPRWDYAYYPLVQDIMRGFVVDRAGELVIDDSLGRVAHVIAFRMTATNALRHDGSVENTKAYFTDINQPGSLAYGSSLMYHVVDPMPFAPISAP